MTYLLFHLWLPLLLGIGLGVIGGVAAARHEDARWRSPFLILVALATLGALVLAWLGSVPGRPGLWVEIAAGFGLAYLVGRLPAQGIAMRAMADVTRSDLAPRGDTRVEPELPAEPDRISTAAPPSAPLATGALLAPATETKPPAVIVAENKSNPRSAAGRKAAAGKGASPSRAKAAAAPPIIEAVPVVRPPSPDDRPATRRPRRAAGAKMKRDAPTVVEEAKTGAGARADAPGFDAESTDTPPVKSS